MYGTVKKTAAIHDLSGFGRGSLTTIIPILSTMGIQVCPLPTAVLSNHTGGFEEYSYLDLTDSMEEYISMWKKLNLSFDCIYSGFLGSTKQIEIVSEFLDFFGTPENLVAVDPVMGDNGELYSAMKPDIVPQMKKLISKATLITPNFTEAGFLLGLDKACCKLNDEKIKKCLKDLSDLGPKIAVITSVPDAKNPNSTVVAAYDRENDIFWKVKCPFIPAFYPGTGDAFASVLIGSLLQGDSLPVALDRGTQFISQCIKASYGFNYPRRNGVLLEKELGILNMPVLIRGYEML